MSLHGFVRAAGYAALIGDLAVGPAVAMEGGAGFYLPGSRTSQAGILPPPGLYFQNDLYFFSGGVDLSVPIPSGNFVLGGLDATVVFELPTLLWSTPVEVLGGNLGFGLTVPIGYKDVEASLGGLSVEDSITAFGDPVASASIGWHSGNFHWQTVATVNIPIGQYDADQLANIGFNRWALDLLAAGTWLDPSVGWEVSGALGLTINGNNSATDYQSGNEAHFEWAVVKHFNQQFSAGAIGYVYQQVTPDSGSGASLGGFEGKAMGIGLTAAYSFLVDQHPVTASFKYLHDFNTENRIPGDGLFLTIATPISMAE